MSSNFEDRFSDLRKRMAQPPRRISRLFGPKEDIPKDVIHVGQRYNLESAHLCRAPQYVGQGYMEAVFVRDQ